MDHTPEDQDDDAITVDSFDAEQITTYHPIRGAFYGLLLGFGLALLLISFKVIYLGITKPIIIIVLGIIAGALWGRFGPAKVPKQAST